MDGLAEKVRQYIQASSGYCAAAEVDVEGLARFLQAEVDALVAAAYEKAQYRLEIAAKELNGGEFEQFVTHVVIPFVRKELRPAEAQNALDAKLATAVALVVQKAAKHVPQFPGSRLYGPLMCSECGMVSDASLPAARFEAWQQHILALAGPNALAEHDAALREQWDNESFPAKWIEAKVKVRDEYIAKLEAENAGLRDRFHKAMKKAGIQGLVIAKVFTYVEGK